MFVFSNLFALTARVASLVVFSLGLHVFADATHLLAEDNPIARTLTDPRNGFSSGFAPRERVRRLFAVIPQTGAANTLSLDFNGGQSILFDSLFLLHRGLGVRRRAELIVDRGRRRHPVPLAE